MKIIYKHGHTLNFKDRLVNFSRKLIGQPDLYYVDKESSLYSNSLNTMKMCLLRGQKFRMKLERDDKSDYLGWVEYDKSNVIVESLASIRPKMKQILDEAGIYVLHFSLLTKTNE